MPSGGMRGDLSCRESKYQRKATAQVTGITGDSRRESSNEGKGGLATQPTEIRPNTPARERKQIQAKS